jgi:hypothetical protein
MTTFRPSRVLASGEMSGTGGISMVENNGPMLNYAGRIGIGKGIDFGINSDYFYVPSFDIRVQLFDRPCYCNLGFGLGFHGDGKSHITNIYRELAYQPTLGVGQDFWYYVVGATYSTTTGTIKTPYLSHEFTYLGGEFSVLNMVLGAKINVTETASIIAEINYVNFKSGGVLWVPGIGIHKSI